MSARSIVSHIARHLVTSVESVIPGCSVDVEYDRWHPDEIEGHKKRLRRRVGSYEEDVYPDIVIHRRSGLSAEHDLPVIEVKKDESPGHQADIEKLVAFLQSPFCYQHAAFLTIPTNGGLPHWRWIEPAEA